MSEYTQQQQTEIIRDAMTLTTAIQIEEEELKRLRAERFRAKPAEPTRKVLTVPQVQAQLPAAPRTQYGYSDYLAECRKKLAAWMRNKRKYVILAAVAAVILLIVLLIVGSKSSGGVGDILAGIFTMLFGIAPVLVVLLLIVSLVQFTGRRNELNQQLARSSDYLKAVEAAKRAAAEQQQRAQEETARQQAQIDARYQSEKEQYETVIIPAYQQELAQWKEKQAEKAAILEDDLKINGDTLANLYETTRLVSLTYRELWILRWLYDDMRSSDHDIRYATELLDRDRQRYATEQAGRCVQEAVHDMESSMMSGFQAVYAAVEEGNEELVRMRRSQNMANAAGIAQRHHLNKTVKAQNQMLEKHFKG